MSQTLAQHDPFTRRGRARLSRLPLTVTAVLLGLAAPAWALPNYAQSGLFLVSAQVLEKPARVKFTWPSAAGAKEYRISRRVGTEEWGEPVATLPGTATEYLAEEPEVDGEYLVEQVTGPVTYKQRLQVAIAKPLVDQRGGVLLLVDGRVAASIYPELQRLKQDLIGDGWTVRLRTVAETNTVPGVREIIRAEHHAHPDLKSVFIIGHVPVPYSGFITHDGHRDHYGAWPADAYYGDLDGVWTDTQLGSLLHGGRFPSSEDAVRAQNRNFPGDGKFDQNELPSDLELSVGRVDFYQMTMFLPKDEIHLLKQYLQKNHEYRKGAWEIPARVLVDANIGDGKSSSFSGGTLRSLAGLFGYEHMHHGGDFFPTVSKAPYLWSYVDGYGHWWGLRNDQPSTATFAVNPTKTVFLSLFGSYVTDFNYGNNPMKAALAAMPYTLAVTWPGEFQDMALGGTIGDAQKRYLNESRVVGYSLLGDPTLRLHVLPPPRDLRVRIETGRARLSWIAPPRDITGYHVYRSPSPEGPFVRLTETEIERPSFQDDIVEGEVTYMIRAIALQTSGSGRYKNAGQGLIQRVRFTKRDSGRFVARLLATQEIVPPLLDQPSLQGKIGPILIHGARVPNPTAVLGEPCSLTLRFSGGPSKKNYDLGLLLQEAKAADISWSHLLALPIAPDQMQGHLEYPISFRVPATIAPGEYRILVTLFSGRDHPEMRAGPGASSVTPTRFEVGRITIRGRN